MRGVEKSASWVIFDFVTCSRVESSSRATVNFPGSQISPHSPHPAMWCVFYQSERGKDLILYFKKKNVFLFSVLFYFSFSSINLAPPESRGFSVKWLLHFSMSVSLSVLMDFLFSSSWELVLQFPMHWHCGVHCYFHFAWKCVVRAPTHCDSRVRWVIVTQIVLLCCTCSHHHHMVIMCVNSHGLPKLSTRVCQFTIFNIVSVSVAHSFIHSLHWQFVQGVFTHIAVLPEQWTQYKCMSVHSMYCFWVILRERGSFIHSFITLTIYIQGVSTQFTILPKHITRECEFTIYKCLYNFVRDFWVILRERGLLGVFIALPSYHTCFHSFIYCFINSSQWQFLYSRQGISFVLLFVLTISKDSWTLQSWPGCFTYQK